MSKKLIIAGGSGTIGKLLIDHLQDRFQEIVVLSRSSDRQEDGYRIAQWDAKNLGSWTKEIEGAELIINLTGKSIETRFTEENKKILTNSRVDSTRAIGEAIKASTAPPEIWLNASGVAIYPSTTDTPNDERITATGTGFKARLSILWEQAMNDFNLEKTRTVALRISPVLTEASGFLPPIKTIAKLGLGGKQGDGKQMVSWIHHRDLCRAVEFIIDHESMNGPVNLCSPNPLSNKQFMSVVRDSVGAPIGIPAPSFAIKLGSIFTGVDASLILDSSYVIPGILSREGFTFQFPELKEALADFN